MSTIVRKRPKETRIVLPVFGNRVSSRLDCAETFILFVIQDGFIQKKEMIRLIYNTALDKINALLKMDIDVLICSGITEILDKKLNNSKIRVISWVQGEIDEIITQFITGDLDRDLHQLREKTSNQLKESLKYNSY